MEHLEYVRDWRVDVHCSQAWLSLEMVIFSMELLFAVNNIHDSGAVAVAAAAARCQALAVLDVSGKNSCGW